MKISELIKNLENHRGVYGDIEVFIDGCSENAEPEPCYAAAVNKLYI